MKKVRGTLLVIFVILGLLVLKMEVINNENGSELKDIKKISDVGEFIVSTKKGSLYNKDGKEIGTFSKGVHLQLDMNFQDPKNNKWKLKNEEVFIKLGDFQRAKSDYFNWTMELDKEKLIPFGEEVKKESKVYESKDAYLILKNEADLSIYKKGKEHKYISFNNFPYYVDNENIIKSEKIIEEKVGAAVPVLMYHYFYDKSKGETPKNSNYLDVSQFEEQIKFLKEEGYYGLSSFELNEFLDGEINVPEKSFVMTIDDGHPTMLTYAYPVLDKYESPAIAFLITRKGEMIDPSYRNKNVELLSHTDGMHQGGCTGGHGGLMQCIDIQKGIDDLRLSAKKLNGAEVLAYPYGDVNENTRAIVEGANFKMGFTTKYGKVQPGMDKLVLPRVRIQGGDSLEIFKKKMME